MKRRKPLPRSTKRIRRSSSRIAPRKVDPKKRRWAKHRCPELCEWIREQPCFLGPPCWEERIECAHVKSRATGGDDRDNVLPMCLSHHREQHEMGIKSFAAYYRVDLKALAKSYTDMWLAGHPEEGAA